MSKKHIKIESLNDLRLPSARSVLSAEDSHTNRSRGGQSSARRLPEPHQRALEFAGKLGSASRPNPFKPHGEYEILGASKIEYQLEQLTVASRALRSQKAVT
jgi:hypothetical protein